MYYNSTSILYYYNIIPPRGSEVKVSACNTGDLGSIPGLGRSPGEGNGNLLQDSCLENPMGRGAWRATIHGVAKSQTQLKWLSTHHELYEGRQFAWWMNECFSKIWKFECHNWLLDGRVLRVEFKGDRTRITVMDRLVCQQSRNHRISVVSFSFRWWFCIPFDNKKSWRWSD